MTTTRHQRLSTLVYNRVIRLVPASLNQPTEAEVRRKTDYGSMAHKLPVLIHNAGLIQALTFVHARGNEYHRLLLADLAAVLGHQSVDSLLNDVRKANLAEYMRLTLEAGHALVWFKRLAQSVLDVDAATEESNA